jgi:hypothetical protein
VFKNVVGKLLPFRQNGSVTGIVKFSAGSDCVNVLSQHSALGEFRKALKIIVVLDPAGKLSVYPVHSRVLRKIFGPKREEDRSWRNLHNDELHSLYSSPNIVRVIGFGWEAQR